jgi:hypothetical protein
MKMIQRISDGRARSRKEWDRKSSYSYVRDLGRNSHWNRSYSISRLSSFRCRCFSFGQLDGWFYSL